MRFREAHVFAGSTIVVEIKRNTLEHVIADTQSTLKALHIELRDEEAEVASPLTVDALPPASEAETSQVGCKAPVDGFELFDEDEADAGAAE